MKTYGYTSFSVTVLFSSDEDPEVELLDHLVALFFTSLRKLHTVFYSGCTNLHSPQHSTAVPFPQHLLFLLLAKSRSHRWEVIPHSGFDLHVPGGE